MRRFAGIVAVTLLFALAIVLQHGMVVCQGAHCSARVEIVHTSKSCCEHAHEATAQSAQADAHGDHVGVDREAGDELPALRGDHGGCVDAPLCCEQGPLPQPTALPDPQLAPAAFWPTAAAGAVNASPRPAVLPPPTGPPRPAAPPLLRRTIVLQV